MSRPGLVQAVVNWLRAGYPDGVPRQDYSPILALLRRQISEEEAQQIARDLVDRVVVTTEGPEPISKIDAEVLMTKILNDLPSEADVERVKARLEKAGWPFDMYPLGEPPEPDAE